MMNRQAAAGHSLQYHGPVLHSGHFHATPLLNILFEHGIVIACPFTN